MIFMKKVFYKVGAVAAICVVIYSLITNFIQQKIMVCNDIEISRGYKYDLQKRNLLDSLCYYRKEMQNNNFIYLNKILELDKTEEYSLESKIIIENLLVSADQNQLKVYYNNATPEFRLLVYFILKLSDNEQAELILRRIFPMVGGNDFRFE